jgi:hypothetical protein
MIFDFLQIDLFLFYIFIFGLSLTHTQNLATQLCLNYALIYCATRFYFNTGSTLVCGFGYSLLRQNAAKFLMDDLYRNPGPLQFDGPGADSKALSLCVEDQDYMGRIKKLQEYLDQVLTILLSQIFNFTRASYEHCYENKKSQNHSVCKVL